ncbi:MAG TPA: (d)CMP kinase [Actinomycetota bacterium]|nr:(d)CMP kinase [Actinomycetota bacterium]
MNPEEAIPKRGVVVAIDGPAGAGKSTVAARLAEALRLPYVNTGVMYRALTRRALDMGVDPGDGPALAALARQLRFALDEGEPPSLLVDGRPPDRSLLAADVEESVSRVASHPDVRMVLRAEQRRLGAQGCVMEGRDIASAVFPDADVKIFVVASPEVRAWRRVEERGGAADAVARRDASDSVTNPLVPAPDAYVLDTTTLDPDEAVDEALAVVRRALAGGPTGEGRSGRRP